MKPPLEHTLSLPQAPAIVNERHRRIMALLHQQTSLSVSQLAHMLGVSEVTIRKDLTQLEQQQMLYRVHGSAILANPYIQERHVNDKEKLCSDQKRAIGAYAARLVEPRDTILIASGTTTLAMAREIREVEELTAITTSLSVATTLAENDECTVIQLGGALRNSSFSVVGPFAEQMLRQFSCSKLFFGVDGFDLNYGVTTTNLMGGHLALMMIETCRRSSRWSTPRNSAGGDSARCATSTASTWSLPTTACRRSWSNNCRKPASTSVSSKSSGRRCLDPLRIAYAIRIGPAGSSSVQGAVQPSDTDMHSSFSGSVEGRGAKEASKGNEFFYSEFGILKIILNFAPRFERKSVPDRDGAIAQLVEQRTENPCVAGSIPAGTT